MSDPSQMLGKNANRQSDHELFEPYLSRWNLVSDGSVIGRHSSRLLPVRFEGVPAMLKIALEKEERMGALLMVYWDGQGAARVFKHEGDALLMERLEGTCSLAAMAKSASTPQTTYFDDEASRIICDVAGQLHAPKKKPAPQELLSLTSWFRDLEHMAANTKSVLLDAEQKIALRTCAALAQELLAVPEDIVVLHGDIHHENILNRTNPTNEHSDWAAIDPKRLLGERGFDFANIFCNPDLEVTARPGRLARQLAVVAEAAHLDRQRLLHWVVAYAGLSAVWTINDGADPEHALAETHRALALMKKGV